MVQASKTNLYSATEDSVQSPKIINFLLLASYQGRCCIANKLLREKNSGNFFSRFVIDPKSSL